MKTPVFSSLLLAVGLFAADHKLHAVKRMMTDEKRLVAIKRAGRANESETLRRLLMEDPHLV